MVILNTDLDNTLIYSYRHELGENKKCVELYEGREISFMTPYAYEGLAELSRRYLLVPTTTRTIEQYRRIHFGISAEYELVCNGGILLKGGAPDEEWYRESLDLIQASGKEMKKALELLKQDAEVCFEIRDISGLFLFTKSSAPEESVTALREQLDPALVDVHSNGGKVYVVPKGMDKGTAVCRLKKKLAAEEIIAAGDSEFDLPMLAAAERGLAPETLRGQLNGATHIRYAPSGKLFSDFIMDLLLGVKKGQ